MRVFREPPPEGLASAMHASYFNPHF
jgi:hypothetical protein